MKRLFCFFLPIFFLASCEKNEPKVAVNEDSGILVVNEGNFGWGNASLGIIGESSNYSEAVFEGKNNRKLGDVFQSIYHHGNSYFLVVNNSGTIEVVNDSNFALRESIKGFKSPQYMVVQNNTAFVTELFEPYITAFPLSDPGNKQEIEIGGSSGKIFKMGNELCVHSKGNLVFVNPTNLSVKDSFHSIATKELDQASETEMALVGKRGDSTYLYVYDRSVKSLSDSVRLDLNWKDPISVLVDKSSEWVYVYSNNKVYSSALNELSTLTDKSYTVSLQQFYGWNVDPNTGYLYICDAKDYVQKGEVHIFDTDINLIEKVKVGVIPNACIFR
jgi:lipocalin